MSTFNSCDNNLGVLLKCDIFVSSFPGHLDLLMEIGIYIQPDMIDGCTFYELKSLEWNNRTTLVLSNTKELNRELFYKLVYLI